MADQGLQENLKEKRIPEDWQLVVVVPIWKK